MCVKNILVAGEAPQYQSICGCDFLQCGKMNEKMAPTDIIGHFHVEKGAEERRRGHGNIISEIQIEETVIEPTILWPPFQVDPSHQFIRVDDNSDKGSTRNQVGFDIRQEVAHLMQRFEYPVKLQATKYAIELLTAAAVGVALGLTDHVIDLARFPVHQVIVWLQVKNFHRRFHLLPALYNENVPNESRFDQKSTGGIHCGKLAVPFILISALLTANFELTDALNERLEELTMYPVSESFIMRLARRTLAANHRKICFLKHSVRFPVNTNSSAITNNIQTKF